MRECGPNIYFTAILWPPVNGFLAIPGRAVSLVCVCMFYAYISTGLISIQYGF